MRYWATTIIAIDPQDKILKSWAGPIVPGITIKDAEWYCQVNGFGFCNVDGELIAEIPLGADGKPDFQNMIDYEKANLN